MKLHALRWLVLLGMLLSGMATNAATPKRSHNVRCA